MSDTLRTVAFVVIAVDAFGAAMVAARLRNAARSTGIALVTASTLLFAASLVGPSLLDALAISDEAAEIAAGVVLLVPALTLLFRGDELFLVGDTEAEGPAAWRAGVVPLALPLLAGPAPLAVVAALAARDDRGEAAIGVTVAMVVASAALVVAVRHRRDRRTILEAITGHFVGAAMVFVAFALVVDGVLGV
jgi:multiple antibiotic resistance protein